MRKRKMEHPQADEPQNNKRLQLEATALSEDPSSAIATLTEGTEEVRLSRLHCNSFCSEGVVPMETGQQSLLAGVGKVSNKSTTATLDNGMYI